MDYNGIAGKRLLVRAKRDDTIPCTAMVRLGRNTADMIKIVNSCYKQGIFFRFLDNNLSTEGTVGKMIIQILATVAEAKRERILERTNGGRLTAKASGVKFGKKPHKGTGQAKITIRQDVPMRDVMERTGGSGATYFRLKAEKSCLILHCELSAGSGSRAFWHYKGLSRQLLPKIKNSTIIKKSKMLSMDRISQNF